MSALLPTATGRQTVAAALDLLRARRPAVAGAVLLLVLANAVGLLVPLVLGRIVDTVVHGTDAARIVVLLAVGLLGIAVGQAALTAAGRYLVADVGESTLATLREDVLARALRLPTGAVERAGSGDLVSRVVEDVRLVGDAVGRVVPNASTALLTIVLSLLGMGALDWRFALAGLVAAPIQLGALQWYLRRSAPVYRAERVAVGARTQGLLDALSDTATVTALRLGPARLAVVAEHSQAAVGLSLRSTTLVTRFFGRLNVAELIGLSTVLAVGFLLVRDGSVTLGEATAAALFFFGLFGPVGTVLNQVDALQEAGAGLARLVGVTSADTAAARTWHPPDTDEPGSPAPHDPGPAITATGVGYAYEPGTPVLHDVDLAVAPGEHVALVGASGAGKSTFAKLVAGVHHPTAGTLRSPAGVALVTQEVHVFAGTVAEDLRLARPTATDAELAAALDTVGATAWATALPAGLDTVVGAGGHRLTAAQAQQLALARVVVADPPVAVLDEATAEAGSAGARALDAAAAAVLRGRTALTVAHRLNQAATADRVVVMAQGRVVERGPHEELVAAGGPYARLWAAYTTSREEPTVPENPYVQAVVLDAAPLTPNMVRVRFGGPDVRRFRAAGQPDERLRVVFPAEPGAPTPLPVRDGGDWGWPQDGPQPVGRNYTVRSWDPTAGEVVVDFVVHDGGIAATWAQQARPGETLVLSEAAGWYAPPEDARWQLLVADMTALPALARIVEELPAGTRAHAVVEVIDAADRQELRSAAALTVDWRVGCGNGVAPNVLDEAVRAFEMPDEPGYVWFAGEAATSRAVQRYLRHERGWPAARFESIGYWRLAPRSHCARQNRIVAKLPTCVKPIRS